MNEHKNRWRIRRRIIIATLIFNATVVAYLVWKGNDTELNREISTALIFLTASVIGSYLFGSAWDDKNNMHNKQ